MSKVPKIEVGNIFAIERKNITTVFVLYCDAKTFIYFIGF